MSYRPYPDVDRALRQLERHVPGSLRDPHAYEPQILTVAEWLAEPGAAMRLLSRAGYSAADVTAPEVGR